MREQPLEILLEGATVPEAGEPVAAGDRPHLLDERRDDQAGRHRGADDERPERGAALDVLDREHGPVAEADPDEVQRRDGAGEEVEGVERDPDVEDGRGERPAPVVPEVHAAR